MSTPNTLNQTQRKAFEDTLRENRREARNTLGTKRNEARATALQQLIEKHEAQPIVDQINACKAEIETSENELKEKGFELRYDGEIRISSDATALDEEFEAAVDHAVR